MEVVWYVVKQDLEALVVYLLVSDQTEQGLPN